MSECAGTDAPGFDCLRCDPMWLAGLPACLLIAHQWRRGVEREGTRRVGEPHIGGRKTGRSSHLFPPFRVNSRPDQTWVQRNWRGKEEGRREVSRAHPRPTTHTPPFSRRVTCRLPETLSPGAGFLLRLHRGAAGSSSTNWVGRLTFLFRPAPPHTSVKTPAAPPRPLKGPRLMQIHPVHNPQESGGRPCCVLRTHIGRSCSCCRC